MRGLADAERLRRFLRELAREADADAAVYLTGGATAVLIGWRESTIDADILIVPEHDSLYRALPRLKEELQLNVEIVSPALGRGLVEPQRLRELFEAIEPRFHRHPAIDPPSFRKRLEDVLRARS
jgi:hypothetical protein